MENIFDLTTTDIPYYDKLLKYGKGLERDDIEVTATIEYMSPDEYFQYCAIMHKCTVQDEFKYIDERNMQELTQVVESDKLPIGFLNNVCREQEGRHRALLAKRLGIELIPVLVIKNKEEKHG